MSPHRYDIVTHVEFDVEHFTGLHTRRSMRRKTRPHVMMQFVVIEMESVAPVIQEPYQHHVDLQCDGKWNLEFHQMS